MPPTLTYPAVRLGGCRAALRGWLRRWAVYGLVAGGLVGAGSNSPLASAAAVAAWSVLAVMQAAAHPLAMLGVALLQAGLGGVWVWALRGLLWQRRWAAAERALPIPPAAIARSDRAIAAWGVLPLVALYGLGGTVWVAARPAWLMPSASWAAAGLALLVLGTWAAGVAVLQGLRWSARWVAGGRRAVNRPAVSLPARVRPAVDRPAEAGHEAPAAAVSIVTLTRSALMPLWLLPLWRGPARRTGLAVLLGSTGLPAWAASGPWLGADAALPLGAWIGWWLAGFSLLSLGFTTAINHLSRLEFAPLARAIAPLPLSPRGWAIQRAALAGLPGLLGLLAVGAALAGLPSVQVRPGVALAFIALAAAVQAWEIWATAPDPAAKASRWLLGLAVVVALASEVAR